MHETRPLGLLIASRLGLTAVTDKRPLTAGSIFYLPRCPKAALPHAQTAVGDGAPLPVDDLLAAAPPEPRTAAPKLTGLAAALASFDTSSEEIREDLSHLDPGIGYEDWRNVVWGIAATGNPEAEQLAREWSMKSEEKWDEAAFYRVWNSNKRDGITYGTVKHMARVATDRDAPWAEHLNMMPEGYRIAKGCLQVRVSSDDKEGETWETLTAYPVLVTSVVRIRGTQERRATDVTVFHRDTTTHSLDMQQLGREYEIALNNIGVSVHGKRAAAMKAYLIAAKGKYESEGKVTNSYNYFGWQTDKTFLVGNRLYARGAAPVEVHLQRGPALLAKFMPRNMNPASLTAWVEAAKPMFGNELQTFAFVMSLASVLMKLSGEPGGLFSIVGPSGQGKSTVQAAVASVFGGTESSFSKAQDTEKARIAFMATMHSLPVQMEELTKMDPEKLCTLTFDISEGKTRRTLTQTGEMRDMPEDWHLIATASSNTSLLDTVLQHGIPSQALRILEMRLILPPGVRFRDGVEMRQTMLDNAGAVGHALAMYIVEHQSAIAANIKTVLESIDALIGKQSEERIRRNMLACGAIMSRILRNILGFEVISVRRMIDIGCGLITHHRDQQLMFNMTPLDLLTAYINDQSPHCITAHGGNVVSMVTMTKPPYTMRFDTTENRLYIDLAAIRSFIIRHRGDWTEFLRTLKNDEILFDRTRITITKGAAGVPPQGQTTCIVVNTSRLDLGLPLPASESAQAV